VPGRAQTTAPPAGENAITKFRIQPKSGGRLFVTIDGKEKQIAKAALDALIIEGGRKLAYLTSEAPGEMGAGGTVMLFDPKTNQHKKLATSEDDIKSFKAAAAGDGKTALLLETSGAEDCAPEVVIIDPGRGEVFSESPAKVLSIKGDAIALGYFKETEFDKNCSGKKMTPYKTKNFSLSALLRRPVINRRQTN
jgi:hypothetical protein